VGRGGEEHHADERGAAAPHGTQVLRYCQLLEEEQDRTVKPMIATDVRPTDPTWIDLCAREGIVLVWGPETLAVP
jgi:hypothetical protein